MYYGSDVRDTVMILYVICQLVCMIDLWAHTSFVHSILSLKLGVTLVHSQGPVMVPGLLPSRSEKKGVRLREKR